MKKIVLALALTATISACAGATTTPLVPPASTPAAVANTAGAAPSGTAAGSVSAGLPQPSLGPEQQTITRAEVTVVADWKGPSSGAVFEIQMDNHMIDLASMDLSTATLTNGAGAEIGHPTWVGGASGHHRNGTLAFDKIPEGFFSGGSWIKLDLPAVGDAEPREFAWATH